MIGVGQTTFGHPGGNCFSACVASLLELPIDDVPYFMAGDGAEWFDRLAEWLKPRGLYPLLFKWSADWPKTGFGILGGKSSRGDHAVVGYGREVVHDPHPSREGLLAIEDVTILVPLDPAKRGAT